MMTVNVNLALSYLMDFLYATPVSLGYLSAGIYFLGKEFDFGASYCEAMGYGY